MEPWFRNEILTGLQKLYTLSLDQTPSADTLPGTAMTWVEALTHGRNWEAERDTPRIREAFSRMVLNCTHWPKPRDLLDALPSSTPAPALTHDRGIPPSREGRARHLADLLGELYNPATADPNYDPARAHRNLERMELEAGLIARAPVFHNPPSADEE